MALPLKSATLAKVETPYGERSNMAIVPRIARGLIAIIKMQTVSIACLSQNKWFGRSGWTMAQTSL